MDLKANYNRFIRYGLLTIGLGLFAWAIWKTDIFPKWSGWVVVIGWLLLLVQTSYIIQILGNVIWGAGYLWMAAYSWEYFS